MKPQIYSFFFLLSFSIFFGCSPVATSLLTDRSSTCDPTVTSCLDDDDSSAAGAIDIQPDTPDLSMNIDKGNTIEITGSCKDLGRRKNRILVEVFAGDLNEAVEPYISNDRGSNCYNFALAGETSSGIMHDSPCFWVTKGIGLVEDPLVPSRKLYPQCHNGQFGFSVRLGRVLSDVALGINYRVRFKLRTEDSGISETPWSRVTISRQLTAPSIDSRTIDPTLFKCTLENSVARFNQDITYTLGRAFKLRAGTFTTPADSVTGFTAIRSSNANAFLYEDLERVDGVTYSYAITGSETGFSYVPSAPTAVSNTMQCQLPNPVLIQFSEPTNATCTFNLQYHNSATNVKYQIASGGPNWTGTPGAGVNDAPAPARACIGSFNTAPYTCQVAGLAANTSYRFAVRAYKDTNGNNTPDITEEVGYWSNESTCQTKP